MQKSLLNVRRERDPAAAERSPRPAGRRQRRARRRRCDHARDRHLLDRSPIGGAAAWRWSISTCSSAPWRSRSISSRRRACARRSSIRAGSTRCSSTAAMVRQSDTLYVLSGEESLGDPVTADTSSLDILLKELRNKFHYVVVDLPRQVSPATQYVAQSATNLVAGDRSVAGRHARHAAAARPAADGQRRLPDHHGRQPRRRVSRRRDRPQGVRGRDRPADRLRHPVRRALRRRGDQCRPAGRGRAAARWPTRSSRSPSGSPAIRPHGPAGRRLRLWPLRQAMSMFGRRPLATPQPRRLATAQRRAARSAARARAGSRGATAGSRWHRAARRPATDRRVEALKSTHARIQAALYDRIDATAATKLPRDELNRQILELIGEVVAEQRLSPARPRAGAARRHDRRQHGRPGPARAAAARRDDHRHHGERLRPDLCRAQGQARADRRQVPRQSARHERRAAHRHPDRPPRRRDLPDLRRAARGRQPRQHHRPAAGDRRLLDLDPQVLQEEHHARRDGTSEATSARAWPGC